MSEVIKNLIKYDGITPNISLEAVNQNYRQTILEGVQCVGQHQPQVEQIIKIKGDIEIDHYELVDTPIGKSVEGQNLTGSKMFVVGNFKFRMEYLPQDGEKKVHIAKFMQPFCEYIVLPNTYNANQYMYPVAYIEDMYVKYLDTHTFFYNANILLVAKLY